MYNPIQKERKLITTKDISYSLSTCKSGKDAEKTILREIYAEAPKTAKYFFRSESSVNRPAGWGFLGPLIFTSSVNYYS